MIGMVMCNDESIKISYFVKNTIPIFLCFKIVKPESIKAYPS